jgi:hypothetical protein
MDSINIVLILLILYTIYIIIQNKNNTIKQVSSNNNVVTKKTKIKKYIKNNNDDDADDILNDLVTWDKSSSMSCDSNSTCNSIPTRLIMKPNFQNIQFHNDYRDTITALNNLVPDKKQLFNIANIPLIYSEPEVNEVKNMVKDFVKALNNNINEFVPQHRHKNSGWDEAIVDPTVESGWEKTQKGLGLPVSLYDEPSKKAPVILVAVKKVMKYETEDEIKYSVEIVLQKAIVDDQIIIKADFVQDKRPLMDENNFFKTTSIELQIMIENVFITGYLSDDGDDSLKMFDGDDKKFYDYNELEQNNLTDPKYIQKMLMEKYKQRNGEMESRTAMLDEEGQNFHKTLPHIYDFSNIKGTRTIFDDMNTHKTFE